MGQKISEKQIKEEIRSVVRENIKEVTTNDWHYKAIMSIWDRGGSFTRKKIGSVLCGDPKADRRDIEAALRDTDYEEITDFTDRLRIEGVIKEAVKLTDIESDVANLYAWDGIKTTYSPNTVKDYGQAVVDMAIKLAPKVLTYQKKLKSIGKDIKNSKESEILKAMISFSKSNRLNADTKVSIEDLLFYEGVIKEGEDNIPGGLAKGMTLNDIAEKHGVSVDVLVAEFKKGIQTEMEHTTDREMAKEITLDHLFEDPQYYTKLATVEEYVDDKGVEHIAAALPQTEEEPIKEEEESEETLRGLKEMAMGDLERIADYANMILERMGEGQNLDSWMYSQITLAVDQLNSVHDTMDGKDGVKESVNEYNVNKKFGSKYDIGAGSMGSGTIFWNRAEEEFGDYKKIAHVSDSGKITFYDKKLPSFVKKHVEDYAKTQNESINELTGNEKQIKTGNPANVFYAFYKGKFAAQYWAMNSSDLFNMYWDEFKVRRPAGSQFKLNPEFIIVSKKEYDRNPNHYAKLKPYVDKFWDKLQNESVNEEKVYIDYLNKQKGFKQDRIKFNSYEEAVKWARKNFEKFNPDMIKYESVNEGSLYSSQQWIKKLTPKIEKDVESLKKQFPNYNISLVRNRYEIDGSYTLSISGKNTSDADNKNIQKVVTSKIKESVNEGTEPDIIAQIKNIAKTHQNNIIVDPKSGKKMRVDAFSASAIATVYDALSGSNQEKFVSSGLLGMQQMAMKLLKK